MPSECPWHVLFNFPKFPQDYWFLNGIADHTTQIFIAFIVDTGLLKSLLVSKVSVGKKKKRGKMFRLRWGRLSVFVLKKQNKKKKEKEEEMKEICHAKCSCYSCLILKADAWPPATEKEKKENDGISHRFKKSYITTLFNRPVRDKQTAVKEEEEVKEKERDRTGCGR